MKLFILFSTFFIFSFAAQAKIKIGVYTECPYLCDGGKEKGYIYKILTQTLGEQNISISFVPLYRVIYGLNQGEFDLGLLSSLDILEHPDIHRTSPSLGFHFIGKISKNRKLLKKQLHQLTNHSIILPRESASEILEQKALERNPNWKTNSIQYLVGKDVPTRIIKMIKRDRAEIGIGDFNALSYILGKEGLKDTVFIKASSLAGFTPYILVKKGDRDNQIYKKIQNWLDLNRKNGELQKILKSYNINDWDLYDTQSR